MNMRFLCHRPNEPELTLPSTDHETTHVIQPKTDVVHSQIYTSEVLSRADIKVMYSEEKSRRSF